MSAVNKILAKALSTKSEDEAFAALRMARKKYMGGEVNIGSQTNNSDYEKLRNDAIKLQSLAKYYRTESDHEKRQSRYYFDLYSKQQLDYHIAQDEIRKLKRKVTEKSSQRITNLMTGFLVGFFLSGLVMHLTGLGV